MSPRRIVGSAAVLLFVMFVGWYMLTGPDEPEIRINNVRVAASDRENGTRLEVTTDYKNFGCDQILLARFLMNTMPTPSIALPQRQGPTILPRDQSSMVETINLNFKLYPGTWHMFTVASCYVDKEPVPAAAVSPTALFDIPNGSHNLDR